MSGLSRRPLLDPAAVFGPLSDHQCLGLAVSGGPDSLALMLLAARWAEGRATPRFIVYTVDHGLRPEAAAEAEMVVREATRLGLRARLLRWAGRKPQTGVQAAARAARYRLMADAMREDGAALLLTAHHLADQAETVLMRLAHGSGIEGLRGMDRTSRVEGCDIHRPLLDIDPADLAGLVAAAGLAPAHDPSNEDEGYERVRWRKMLPALAELGLDAGRLATFASRSSHAGALVRETAVTAWQELAEPDDGAASLKRARFAALNPLVATAVLGEALRHVSGNPNAVPLAPLEAIAAALQGSARFRALTLHGCVISTKSGAIIVRREGPRRSQAGKAHAEPMAV